MGAPLAAEQMSNATALRHGLRPPRPSGAARDPATVSTARGRR